MPFDADFQVVVLDRFYDRYPNPDIPVLFGRTLALKLQGYLGQHPYGALPLDSSDYVGTHLLVCRRQEKDRQPVMAYRSITLSCCREFQIPFPALTVLQSSRAGSHIPVVQEILERHQRAGTSVSYEGAWTIAPWARQDRRLHLYLLHLGVVLQVWHRRDRRLAESLACGSIRLRTDKYLEKIGYQSLCHQEEELPLFQQASLLGEEVRMMHCVQITPYAQALAEKYRRVWEDRVML